MSFDGWCLLQLAVIKTHLYQMEKDYNRRKVETVVEREFPYQWRFKESDSVPVVEVPVDPNR